MVLAALFVDDYLRPEGLEGVEPYVLLLLSASGGVIMAQANDLIVLFLGLEVLSVAVYVLAAMHRAGSRPRKRASSTSCSAPSRRPSSCTASPWSTAAPARRTSSRSSTCSANALTEDGLVLAGLALMLVGLGFKVAAVPFHFWTPDVYQGSPSPMVAWMASGVKVAGFAGLIRVFVLAFDAYSVDWQPMIAPGGG